MLISKVNILNACFIVVLSLAYDVNADNEAAVPGETNSKTITTTSQQNSEPNATRNEPAPVAPVPVATVPVAPVPVDPAPVIPAPVAPAPVVPMPVAPVSDVPVSVAPAPMAPAPVAPVPVAPVPVAPVAPVPVALVLVVLAPVAPVPVAPVPVAPVPFAPVPVAPIPIAPYPDIWPVPSKNGLPNYLGFYPFRNSLTPPNAYSQVMNIYPNNGNGPEYLLIPAPFLNVAEKQ